MQKKQMASKTNPIITSDIGLQPNKKVPPGTVGQKDGNKTKLM